MPSTDSVQTSLTALLELRARERGDEMAYMVLEDGELDAISMTYGELQRSARALAGALLAEGARGQRVLLCLPTGLEYIRALFACVYAGAVAVPAYLPDPGRQSRTLTPLRAIAADSQAALAITPEVVRAETEALVGAAGLATRWLSPEMLNAEVDETRQLPPARAGDLAVLIYTSGSTANPRGAMLTHAHLLFNMRAFPGYVGRQVGAFTSWVPLSHDLGLLFGVLYPLWAGTGSVLFSPGLFVQRPARWMEAVSRFRAHVTAAPNWAYDLCARRTTTEEAARLDLSCLCVALNGGEPVRYETLRAFHARFSAGGLRRSALYPAYGLVEATGCVSGAAADTSPMVRDFESGALSKGRAVEAQAGESSTRLVSCGAPVRESNVQIVHPERRELCPPGVIGEIWISSHGVCGGYWGRPEASRRLLRARLAGGRGGPFLRTGDLGFLWEGDLFVTGRIKDLIIVRGINHHPHDIEATVAGAHPAVRPGGVAAFSTDDGEGERLVVVSEVRDVGDGRLDDALAEIRQAIAERHGLDTRSIVLVGPGTLLKTSSGKIRRRACAEAFRKGALDVVKQWREPRPAASSGSTTTAPAPRRQMIEGRLKALVAHRLGLRVSDVAVDVPFSHLGLSSAQSLELTGELEAWLGRRLEPTLLWERPTIAALREHLVDPYAAGHDAGPGDGIGAPIAIIGMSCRFPGAPDIDSFWRLLRDGVDAITTTPASRWGELGLPGKGGFLEGLHLFDPAFFGISPREAPHIDPRQRLVLELSWEALEDAGLPPDRLAGSRTGVFLGVLTNDYEQLFFRDLSRVSAHSAPGTVNSVVANRVSYVLDLRGPSLVVDTACSGSLVAIHLACSALRQGECDLALVGGVSVNLLPNGDVFFAAAGALSPGGRCATFDASADGIARGEGAGMLVLRPLDRALQAGDPVWAVIRGSAVNSDGRTNGLMAPSVDAQRSVLQEAYRRAGVGPGRVQYIEAHGTGTPLGDPIEVRALAAELAPHLHPGHVLRLGSVKTNLGHLESAVGVAGVIKVALAMRHRQLPASLHFAEPNPLIPFEELPIDVQAELGPWPRPDEPLIAGVSGFGFGGTNAHVVLEAPGSDDGPRPDARNRAPSAEARWRLLPVSARTAEAARARAQALEQLLRRSDAAPIDDICHTAASRRSHLSHRLAAVGRSPIEMAEELGLARPRQAPGAPRVAFVFSGQGTHWAGMAADLSRHEPAFRSAVERCDTAFRRRHGWSVVELMAAPGETSRLAETDVMQAAIFTVQVGLAEVWRSWGLSPAAVAGQSLGEVAAAHVAGVLSLEDAVSVVHHRGRLMQRVAGRGRTALVGLPGEQARRALEELDGEVVVAGASSPNQCVLSGATGPLQRVLATLEGQGVFASLLPGVDVAFHGPQMAAIEGELAASLRDVWPGPAKIALFSSVTGDRVTGEELDASYWARNLRQPFRFDEATRRLLADGCDTFVEIGPHSVLRSAIVETAANESPNVVVLGSMRRERDAGETMLRAAANLYTRGIDLDFDSLCPAGRCVALPAYPWRRDRHWFAPTIETRRREGRHPLLGEHVLAGVPGAPHVWELDIDASSPGWLADHAVEGAVVVPGAAYLEMGLAAVREAHGGAACSLGPVTFEQLLSLGEPRRVQVVVTTGDAVEVVVLSRRLADEAHWVEHARGGVAQTAGPAGPAVVDMAEALARCLESVDADTHQAAMRARGLLYGPSFRAVQRVRRRDGEAVAELRLPTAAGGTGRYLVHPALLDAAFQVVSAALPRSAAGVLHLPVGVEGVRGHAPVGDHAWVHVVVRPGGGDDAVQADIVCANDEGRVLVEVDGLRLAAVARERPAAAVDQGVASLLYEERWLPLPRLSAGEPAAAEGRWLVLSDVGGVAGAVAEGLRAAGAECLVLTGGQAPGHHLRGAAGVVYLRSLDADVSAVPGVCPELLDDVRLLVQAMVRLDGPPPRLWLVTRRARHVPDDEAVPGLAQSPLWGFGRVLAHEHPEIWGGLVDLDLGGRELAAEAVIDAIGRGQGERERAYRGGAALVPRLARLEAGAGARARGPRSDGTYVVTGGQGGIGLEVARWLARTGAGHIVLIGRRRRPGAIAAVRDLRDSGVSVLLATADVGDERQLSRALDHVGRRGWPPIRGVVHAAGVVDDRLLARMDADSVRNVLRPKVLGAWNLHRLLADAPLDFFVTLSSVSALVGPIGQANYAAANAFLDGLAHVRRAEGRPATTVAYGPWAEVGMWARMQEQGSASGWLLSLSPEDGLRGLEWALEHDVAHLVVMRADWARFSASPGDRLLADLGVRSTAMADASSLIAELLTAGPEERRERIVAELGSMAAEVLRLEAGQLETRAPLSELGMDSVMAAELRSRIGATFAVPVPFVMLLGDGTVDGLAELVGTQIGHEEPAIAAIEVVDRGNPDAPSVASERA